MQNVKAFSLIELLIVITIVGILAAVAVPFYKDYSARANLGKLISIMNSLMDQSVLYADSKGVFPSSYTQLGVATPGDLSPYLSGTAPPAMGSGPTLSVSDESNPTPCGSEGAVIMVPNTTFNADVFGSNFISQLSCRVFHVDGVFKRYCYLYKINTTTSEFTASALVPSTAMSFTELNDLISDDIAASSCM